MAVDLKVLLDPKPAESPFSNTFDEYGTLQLYWSYINPFVKDSRHTFDGVLAPDGSLRQFLGEISDIPTDWKNHVFVMASENTKTGETYTSVVDMPNYIRNVKVAGEWVKSKFFPWGLQIPVLAKCLTENQQEDLFDSKMFYVHVEKAPTGETYPHKTKMDEKGDPVMVKKTYFSFIEIFETEQEMKAARSEKFTKKDEGSSDNTSIPQKILEMFGENVKPEHYHVFLNTIRSNYLSNDKMPDNVRLTSTKTLLENEKFDEGDMKFLSSYLQTGEEKPF